MRANEENNSVWNPEEAYRQSRAGGVRLLLVILVIAAAGAFLIARQAGNRLEDLVLEASTSFEEADEILRDAGWKPTGKIHQNDNETACFYEGKDVFGCEPVYATLQERKTANGRELRLGYAFEEVEKSGMEDPGEVFRQLRDSLDRLYGSPENLGSGSTRFLQWKQSEEGTIVLGYMMQSAPVLFYTWTEGVSHL